MTKFALILVVISMVAPVYAESKSSKNTQPFRQEKIYDSHGQLQQTIKRDSSGNQNIFDKHGQLQGYVKPNGVIMDKHGQEIGRIKPGD